MLQKNNKKITFSWMLLFVISVLFFVFAYEKTENVKVYVLTLMALGICVVFGQKRDFLNANNLFLAYYTYTIGIGPIILLTQNILLKYNYYTVILGGLLAFTWGTLIASNKRKNKSTRTLKLKVHFNINRVHALRALWVLSVLSGLLYVYKNRSLLFSGDVQNGRVSAMAGNGALIYLSQIAIVVLPMMYEVYYDSRHIYHRRRSSLAEVFGMTVISFLVLIMQGYRSNALTMCLCLVFMIVNKKNISSRQIVILGFVGIVIVELLGMMRNAMSSSTAFLANPMFSSLLGTLVVHCHNLNYVFLTFPSRTPFQYGKTYFMDFLMLRPGPDVDFTLWLKEQVGVAFAGGGRTPSILGEQYINFDLPFVFIGMFIMGVLGVLISDNYEKKKGNFISIYIMWQFAHTASGGISNVVIPVFINLVVFIFADMFPQKRRYSVQRLSGHKERNGIV